MTSNSHFFGCPAARFGSSGSTARPLRKVELWHHAVLRQIGAALRWRGDSEGRWRGSSDSIGRFHPVTIPVEHRVDSRVPSYVPQKYRNDFSEPPRTPQESWQQEMQLLRRSVEDGFSKQLTILNDLRIQGIHREPRLQRPTFAHSNTETEVTMHHWDVPQHLVPQLTQLRIHWSYHVLPLAH